LIAPPGREPARTMAVLGRNGVLPHGDHELLALRVVSEPRTVGIKGFV